jgi:hypothetical protein
MFGGMVDACAAAAQISSGNLRIRARPSRTPLRRGVTRICEQFKITSVRASSASNNEPLARQRITSRRCERTPVSSLFRSKFTACELARRHETRNALYYARQPEPEPVLLAGTLYPQPNRTEEYSDWFVFCIGHHRILGCSASFRTCGSPNPNCLYLAPQSHDCGMHKRLPRVAQCDPWKPDELKVEAETLP